MSEPYVTPDEIVMYIIVRTSLNMPKGKLAAQVGHAVQLATRKAEQASPNYLIGWEYGSYAKVVLGATDTEFSEVQGALKEANVYFCTVTDEGRTQFHEPTVTTMGIVPTPKSMLKNILGKLKLL